MSDAPSSVRATARVGVRLPSEPAGAATLVTRRRHGHLGAISVAQMLLVEVMLVAVLATGQRGPWMVAGGAAVGLVVMAAVFGRWQGRWWAERMLLVWRYRRRAASRPSPSADRRLSALRGLAPDVDVHNVEVTDGVQVGVGRDSAGWFAVVAVAAAPGMRGDVATRLPLDRLARTIAESGQPGALVQVVVHTTPAPSAALAEDSRCATSYGEVLDTYAMVPAHRAVWVAVRLDARSLAEATVDGDDESEKAPVVVAALARRVGKTVTRAGLTGQVLDADGLLDALARSCDLEQPPSAGAAPAERWRSWRSSGLSHACFWVRRWPPPADGATVLEGLAAARAAVTSVAVILEPDDDGTDLRCLVRVAAAPDALGAACRAVTDAAARAGAQLFRLDGEQAPAVYASAPTGGGAR